MVSIGRNDDHNCETLQEWAKPGRAVALASFASKAMVSGFAAQDEV